MSVLIFSKNDFMFRNIEIWELISPNDMIQYQRPDENHADFIAEGDFNKIGEVIRVDGTKCLNNS